MSTAPIADLVAACQSGDVVEAVSLWDGGSLLDPSRTFVAHQSQELTVVVQSTLAKQVRGPSSVPWTVVSRMIVGDEDVMVFENDRDGRLRCIDGFRLGQDEVTIHPAGTVYSAGNPGELPSLGLHVYLGWHDALGEVQA